MLTVEIEQENNQVDTVPLLNQGKLYAKLIEAVNEILTQISTNQEGLTLTKGNFYFRIEANS